MLQNFEGLHSTTAILLEGNLHTRMIQSRLTPRLRYHVPIVQSVLSKHISKEIMAAEGLLISPSIIVYEDT